MQNIHGSFTSDFSGLWAMYLYSEDIIVLMYSSLVWDLQHLTKRYDLNDILLNTVRIDNRFREFREVMINERLFC